VQDTKKTALLQIRSVRRTFIIRKGASVPHVKAHLFVLYMCGNPTMESCIEVIEKIASVIVCIYEALQGKRSGAIHMTYLLSLHVKRAEN
jgi:hypothetical protein